MLTVPSSIQAQLDLYRTEAETLVSAGKLEDALLSYETALLDPRLEGHPSLRSEFAMGMGALQLQLAARTTDRNALRKQLDHTISLIRRCLRGLAAGQASGLHLLLAQIHCAGFERFGERRDLLAAHVLLDDLAASTADQRVQIDSIRQRLASAQASGN